MRMMTADRQHILRKRLRLRQLRAFCHAARLGSMSGAAQHLGVSSRAVFRHVLDLDLDLEHELGELLFERGGVGVRKTAAGETLEEVAAPLVERMEDLPERFAAEVRDGVQGELDLAASVLGTGFVLPSYVKGFRDRYPGVRLRLKSCPLDEGIARLRAQKAELVLAASEPLGSHAIEYREMLSYSIVLITSLDHPLAGRKGVTPREAAKWPAIVPPEVSQGLRFHGTAACEFGVGVGAALEVGGWGLIKRYVEQGLGICFVPSICIRAGDQVSVIPMKGHFPVRSFGVYTRRNRVLTAPAQRFLDLLIPAASLGTP